MSKLASLINENYDMNQTRPDIPQYKRTLEIFRQKKQIEAEVEANRRKEEEKKLKDRERRRKQKEKELAQQEQIYKDQLEREKEHEERMKIERAPTVPEDKKIEKRKGSGLISMVNRSILY